jgi:hypothetical protein
MAFGTPGKKLGGDESREKQKGNNFLHEASDYEDESVSARGKPAYSGRKIPDDCSHPSGVTQSA